MTLIHCDRCGRGIRESRDPADNQPGVCAMCGEYLCAKCAGEFANTVVVNNAKPRGDEI